MEDKQLNIIKEVLKKADSEDKFIFLKGGWNIDLAYGKKTREHWDVDFHYELKDKDFWKNWTIESGGSFEDINDWYFVSRLDDVVIDFEGVKVKGDKLEWVHGRESLISDVVEKATYDGNDYNRMKLNVEKYLKEKSKKIRDKDLHDIKTISEIEEKQDS
jgi:hypothetical protein